MKSTKISQHSGVPGKKASRRSTSNIVIPRGIKQMMADANDVIYTTQSLADEWGTTVAAIQKRIQRQQLPAHYMGRWFLLKSEIVGVTREQLTVRNRNTKKPHK